jgi:hypothetical protein
VEPEPPAVTGVTITAADPVTLSGVLAGKNYVLYAEVSGSAEDKTVEWTVDVADIDVDHVKEAGTGFIRQKSGIKLTIDGGQKSGTQLAVTATSTADPSVAKTVIIPVVEPGARLYWSPTGGIAVSIDNTTGDILTDSEELIANGRLLEIYGKDIQILDGDYIEGEHYTVRRVDALNQRVEGGVITVTGIPDEGIISVTLAGPVYGTKGPIGITLLPSVLTGADAGEIDLAGPGAELLFNITANTLITDLSGVSDIPVPLTGAKAPDSLTVATITGTATPIMKKASIEWKGLSGNLYTNRTQAVATVEIEPTSGYTFYPSDITEAKIKAKFRNGSPEVAFVGAPSAGKVVVSLTYNIKAMPIKLIQAGTSPNHTTVAFGLNSALKDQPLILDGGLFHGQEAPTALRVDGGSLYYSVDRPVVWKEGLSGKTFFGGYTAVAEVTLPTKPGYTFEGTDITNETIRDVFTADGANPIVEITRAEADSLVFTLSYNVPKSEIDLTILGRNVTPLSTPVINTKPAASFTASKTGPIVDKSPITWGGVSGASFASGQTPSATVTLVAKPGYEFESPFNEDGDDVRPFLAPGATTIGTISYGDKLVLVIQFGSTLAAIGTDDLSLGAISVTGGNDDIVHTLEVGAVSFSGGEKIEGTDNGSEFEWGNGWVEADSTVLGNLNGGKLNATVLLKPKPGYTFGTAPITNLQFRDRLATLLTVGVNKPDIAGISVQDSDDLKIDVKYTIANQEIERGIITSTLIGDISAANVASSAIPAGTNIDEVEWDLGDFVGTNMSAKAVITAEKGTSTAATFDKNDLVANNHVVITITLTANEYYQFDAFNSTQKAAIAGDIDGGANMLSLTGKIVTGFPTAALSEDFKTLTLIVKITVG